MATNRGCSFFGFIHCDQSIIGAFKVLWTNGWGGDEIEFDYCEEHEREVKRMAEDVVKVTRGVEGNFNILIVRIVEGECREVKQDRLPSPRLFKEF